RDASEGGMQLRIAASDTICRYLLVPFFRDLHEQFPDVHINILNGTSPHCAQMLESGQVDLIVANSPNESLTGNMQIREIREFADVFVGNPSYFPACVTGVNGKPRTLTMKELLTYPLLMLSKRSATSSFLHEQFQKHSLELVPSIELSSNDLLLDLARIGLGIACVPDFCIPQSETTLQRLTIKESLPKRKLVIAYDEKWPLSLPARALIDALTGAE
ncbi:MAG: LysR family transcriptional regulator substrate-binding protein, partial [Lachnospiraceae bacterium]|nr:LysR family transcriptional regulator substrate-binding protein [Lachnospiraceae bacterium]